jgi:hypothetical protein
MIRADPQNKLNITQAETTHIELLTHPGRRSLIRVREWTR